MVLNFVTNALGICLIAVCWKQYNLKLVSKAPVQFHTYNTCIHIYTLHIVPHTEYNMG